MLDDTMILTINMLTVINKFIILLFCLVTINSCTNDLPKKNSLFSANTKNMVDYVYHNLNDPLVLELLKTSRENVKNLPDMIDFGIMELNEEKKYTFYDVFIENGEINTNLFTYNTLDSISIAPYPDYTGDYNGFIYLNLVEKDKNGTDKDHSKQIEIKAIVVEKKTIKDEDNPIIEIWKDKNIKKIYRN